MKFYYFYNDWNLIVFVVGDSNSHTQVDVLGNSFLSSNTAAFVAYSAIGMHPGPCIDSTPSSEWCLVFIKLTFTGVMRYTTFT